MAIRAVAVVVFLSMSTPVLASYCVYVGKNLTADGSVFLGGYGDEPLEPLVGDRVGTDFRPRRDDPSGCDRPCELPRRDERDTAAAADGQVHHHELLRVRRLPGAAHQWRAQRARRGGA